MNRPTLIDLIQEIDELLKDEIEKCRDYKDGDYWTGYHTGKYDGLKMTLDLIKYTSLK